MHPMFVQLFLETGENNTQDDESDTRRAANRAKRNRSRVAINATARDRDRRPRR